jgi:hypothetical protein
VKPVVIASSTRVGTSISHHLKPRMIPRHLQMPKILSSMLVQHHECEVLGASLCQRRSKCPSPLPSVLCPKVLCFLHLLPHFVPHYLQSLNHLAAQELNDVPKVLDLAIPGQTWNGFTLALAMPVPSLDQRMQRQRMPGLRTWWCSTITDVHR